MNAPQSLQHHFTSMQGIFQHMIPDFNETAITEKGSNFFISYWLKLIWENGILPENCTIASLLTGLFLLFWRSIFSSPYSNFKLGMKLMKEQLTGQSTKQSQGWRLPCCPVPFSQSAQLLSRVWLFANPWITACQASLFITNSWSLLKLMSIRSVMPSSHLILCHPLLLLPPIPPSIRVFSNESTLHMRWPKYWSFSFKISPSKGHPGLISFRMDWLDLLAVQGTLKSLLQHHSSKVSILRCSAFFTVQLSHPYMTIGKTIALTRQTFDCKVMSLLLICCLGWS